MSLEQVMLDISVLVHKWIAASTSQRKINWCLRRCLLFRLRVTW